MKVSIPAGIATGLAALFSVYHLVLAATTLTRVSDAGPVVACMALYAAATGVVLFVKGRALPVWAACFSLATAVVMPVVAAPVVELGDAPGYATWWIAAVGTLMVILVVRGRGPFAWVGVGFLALHTVAWAGVGALGSLGVLGSISWVLVATAFAAAMNRATRITRDFVRAEQETADWQAAQDAHVFERQFRLSQTTRMALPMLQRIIDSCGDLSEAERTECLHLEQAIRDEIRGRSLLSDDVRDEVMRLRRRGAVVQLHDDGGLDELEVDDIRRIHGRLADALRQAHDADNVIVRTVPEGSGAAVTVVGLRLDGEASESAALGAGLHDDEDDGDEDDSVALWLEIPRHEPA
ncbi:hypothetical protein EDF24_1951 [Curtobacterium sp. PhB130]|uniref:hypothetical protein n=1 Tax=unclassified Curtobacterium TaxID=257496 RepID=UPI000FBF8D97|nr:MULTISPECIES: hypothetical protein [unclassified Curtobacterium]ROP60390.1 hypothetical protein EDF55_3398 [Curtobacterium sp. ZW137]ROS76362.1 hypothetical protein EDF24_1951 [Curtobacterium sp. PhB130]